MATLIDGNKFVNCILLGSGEIVAALISGYMLSKMPDNVVFALCSMTTVIANTTCYFVPEGIPQYALFLLAIIGIAGQFNAIFVLVELRLPPEKFGAAVVIMITVGTLTGCAAPYVS